LKQPDVLDGDDGLVGEGFKQLDLSVRERADLNAANCYSPNWITFTQQRRCKHGPLPEALLESLADRELVVRLSREIMDVDRLPVDNGSASYRAAVARQTLVHPWEWP